jgi:hypothetical protein
MFTMTEKPLRKLPVVLFLLFVAIFLVGAVSVAADGQQRPIEDFVERQGKYCFLDGVYADPCPTDPPLLFVPPVDNFIGWTDPALEIAASVDYAGLANECAGGAFGTETSGSITERTLADGRAEVHVRLHTTNALTWVADGFDFNGPLLFGERLVEDPGNCGVLPPGAEAALGSSLLNVTFTNTAPGAPLPDLIQLLVDPEEGQEPIKLSLHGRAGGRLADGTPGHVTVVETALFMTSSQGATTDGFPVERIILRSVGQ